MVRPWWGCGQGECGQGVVGDLVGEGVSGREGVGGWGRMGGCGQSGCGHKGLRPSVSAGDPERQNTWAGSSALCETALQELVLPGPAPTMPHRAMHARDPREQEAEGADRGKRAPTRDHGEEGVAENCTWAGRGGLRNVPEMN